MCADLSIAHQLLVIEGLASSGNDDHVDVAEILQHKLYYEGETLDMILVVIERYNTQSYKCVPFLFLASLWRSS